MGAKIAIAGAGIYGATAAIRLAERGHQVTLFDPLGVMRAASAINQYRVHSGYHYPRSPETIAETLEAVREFIQEFAPAIVQNSRHHYAIPREGSRTRPRNTSKSCGHTGFRCGLVGRSGWILDTSISVTKSRKTYTTLICCVR